MVSFKEIDGSSFALAVDVGAWLFFLRWSVLTFDSVLPFHFLELSLLIALVPSFGDSESFAVSDFFSGMCRNLLFFL